MKSRTAWGISLALACAVIMGALVSADTNSYFDKGYQFRALKTWDFKTQRRLSADPIANNTIWGDQSEANCRRIWQDQRHCGAPWSGCRLLVAFYVGLQEKIRRPVMDSVLSRLLGPAPVWLVRGVGRTLESGRIPYTE